MKKLPKHPSEMCCIVTNMVERIYRRRQSHVYLKEWMEHKGLSDEQVALRLDVARPTITRWRYEQWRLDLEKLARLAEALGIETTELFHPPERPSLDAIVEGAPEDLRRDAAEIVRRFVGRRT